MNRIDSVMSPSPLVSVVIPAYNADIFLENTLQSICSQSYGNLEILVVDDGSSDRTPAIVQAIAHEDSRVRLLQQPNAGVATARNRGIQAARGEFIAPIDADDLWDPEAVAKMVTQFQALPPTVGVVYAWSMDIDAQGQKTGGFHAATITGNVFKTLICHNFLGNASATLIRKTCLDQIGGYNPQFKAQNAQGCEDWDLYLRLAERYEFAVVPEFLVNYRKLTSSMSGDFSQMARSQRLMLQSIQHQHPALPSYLYRLSRSSFYLYLAQQCHVAGHPRTTLAWLGQAIAVDPITPFVRLGFYLLVLKSLGGLFRGLWSQEKHAISTVLSYAGHPSLMSARGELSISPFKIQIKVLVGTLLHQSLSRI
jgi:cellulose synthase/poly-beta-1,6-N-acetylglucosamine synthase-like glycosyltransferase